MAVTYSCDHCGQTAPALTGWLVISMMLLHMEPDVQPTGRTLDATLPDILFDTVECRDAWCAAKGLIAPL